jgi:hypothetical protein
MYKKRGVGQGGKCKRGNIKEKENIICRSESAKFFVRGAKEGKINA